MPRGGKREGAGRKLGAATQKTREVADRLVADGVTPLEFMMDLMRDPSQDLSLRFDAAKNAAPYVHPKLSSTEAKVAHSGSIGGIDAPEASETPEQWIERRNRELAQVVAAAGATVARN